MNETIKKLLGEELASQVETALKGKGKDGKDIDLVIGNDGSYVPADKLDTERQSRISAENALKTAAIALKEIGGSGDPAKIGDDVKAAQLKIGKLESDHKAEVTKIMRTNALKMALTGKAHDPDDIIKLLELDKIDLDDNGNLKISIDDLTKDIKASKPYLFKEERSAPAAQSQTFTGVKPAGTAPAAGSTGGTDDMDVWRAEAGLK